MKTLYRDHAPRFLAFLYRICGNRQDAEDVAQDAFVTTFERIQRVEPGRFRAFLYRIGIRKCHRLFRRQQLLQRLGFRSAPAEVSDIARSGASPEELAELTRVLAVIAKLPADIRLAWALRRIEGYTINEASAMCGCSAATLKRRLRVAEHALRAHVEDAPHAQD